MRKYLLMLPLALSACGSNTDTYYSLNAAYIAALEVATTFAEDCKPRPETDPCKPVVAKLKAAGKVADEAFEQADKAQGTEGYALALAGAEAALNHFTSIKEGQ